MIDATGLAKAEDTRHQLHYNSLISCWSSRSLRSELCRNILEGSINTSVSPTPPCQPHNSVTLCSPSPIVRDIVPTNCQLCPHSLTRPPQAGQHHGQVVHNSVPCCHPGFGGVWDNRWPLASRRIQVQVGCEVFFCGFPSLKVCSKLLMLRWYNICF